MLHFIFTNVLLICVGTLVYLFVRTLPRIDESLPAPRVNVLERWITSEIPEKLDKTSKAFFLKLLRKFKIFVLKADNLVTRELEKRKPEGREKEEARIMEFREIVIEERVEDGEDDGAKDNELPL